jgi:hypothetical protein
MKLERAILFLTVFITASLVFAQETLSPKEQEEILKILCDGEVITEKGELICKQESGDAWFSEMRWETAIPGRWVANEHEWLITLHGFCHRGCLGRTFIVNKQANQWVKIAETDGRVHLECIRLQRSAAELDRVVCPGVWPHDGSIIEWIEVFSFDDNKFSSRKLLYKEQEGECVIAIPPDKVEYQGDILSELKAGEPDSEIAFTMRLQVRRLENCDSSIEDPDKLAKVKGEYLLKFLKREKEIVPDEQTEKILKATGWMDLPDQH